MDFYEDHRMDDTAGRNLAQVVELSKAITQANAPRDTKTETRTIVLQPKQKE
jgi:hypothetical protein